MADARSCEFIVQMGLHRVSLFKTNTPIS
jgi:hypothetical protein